MTSIHGVASAFLLAATASAQQPAEVPAQPAPLPDRAEVQACVSAATAYLLGAQDENGSWGGARKPAIGFDEFWSNPETHRSWTIATTGLACMALQALPRSEAVDAAFVRGVDWLLETGMIQRPNEWDTDNAWALVYGVQAYARAVQDERVEGTPRGDRLREMGQAFVDKLFTYQTPEGGWGYYDFEVHARRPAWATSFMTASAVLGLLDAKAAGLQIDEKRFAGAVRAVERCRLPNGAYTYSVRAIPSPGGAEGINRIKGSLSRIQVCNAALLLAGSDEVDRDDLRTGLDQFFEHHRFLDIARKKPVPHEAYYLNSGYFYFYGHFYAAIVIEQLPKEERAAYWPKLARHVVKTQEDDGSMWDYYMNSYHKPYGVAFSLLALQPSLDDARKPEVKGSER